jgi:hypothetical protein
VFFIKFSIGKAFLTGFGFFILFLWGLYINGRIYSAEEKRKKAID